jgi:hypothetical protein
VGGSVSKTASQPEANNCSATSTANGSADRTTDYACPFAAQIESRHLGVIAGPAAERLAAAIGAAARLIAVRMLSAQGLKVAAKAVGWQDLGCASVGDDG